MRLADTNLPTNDRPYVKLPSHDPHIGNSPFYCVNPTRGFAEVATNLLVNYVLYNTKINGTR